MRRHGRLMRPCPRSSLAGSWRTTASPRPAAGRRGWSATAPRRCRPPAWSVAASWPSALAPVVVLGRLRVQGDGSAGTGGLEAGPQRGALLLWQPRPLAEGVPLAGLDQQVAGGAGVPVPAGQHDQHIADQDRGDLAGSGRVAPGGRGGGAEVAGADTPGAVSVVVVVAARVRPALGGLQVLERGDGGLGGVGEGVVAPAGKLGGVGRAGDLAGGQQVAVAVADLPGEGQVLPAEVEHPQLHRRDLVGGVGAHRASPSWGGAGGWAGLASLARSAAYRASYSWGWASWRSRWARRRILATSLGPAGRA